MNRIDLTQYLPNTIFSSTFNKLPHINLKGIFNSDNYLRLNLLNEIKYNKLYYWVILLPYYYDSDENFKEFHVIAKFKNKIDAELLKSKIKNYFYVFRFDYDLDVSVLEAFENQTIYRIKNKITLDFLVKFTPKILNKSKFLNITKISLTNDNLLEFKGLKIINTEDYKSEKETFNFWKSYTNNNNIYTSNYRNVFNYILNSYDFTLNDNIINYDLCDNLLLFINVNISISNLYSNLIYYINDMILHNDLEEHYALLDILSENNILGPDDDENLLLSENNIRNINNMIDIESLGKKKLVSIDNFYVIIDT